MSEESRSPITRPRDSLWVRPGIISAGLLIVILVLWEIAGRYGFINPFFLSWPSAIAAAAWRVLISGAFFANLLVTGYAYLVGVVSGCILGSILGLAMGWWRKFGEVIDPFIVFFSAMPRIALYPVLLMIFGVGDMSRILIVFIGVLFPVVFNAYVGAKQTPPLLVDVARVFGYSSNKLFLMIVVPASLPYLMAGVRIGITLGMILVVVAEFFGGSSGLGYEIALTAQMYKTPEMYAWVIYTSLAALAIVRFADFLERRVLRRI